MDRKEVQPLNLLLRKGHQALKALEEAIATDDGDKKSRHSLLLSFIFTFEMAIKCLIAALAARGVSTPDYAVAVLKTGFQAEVIDDPATWDALREYRNSGRHASQEEPALKDADLFRPHAVGVVNKVLIGL